MAVAGGASSSVFLSPAKETPALAVNPANVPALEIKLGALVVLLSVTLLFGFTPFCIVRGAGCFSVQPDLRRLLLSLISCFAGGVFFATCLLDLLPDYLQSISEAFSSAGITTLEFSPENAPQNSPTDGLQLGRNYTISESPTGLREFSVCKSFSVVKVSQRMREVKRLIKVKREAKPTAGFINNTDFLFGYEKLKCITLSIIRLDADQHKLMFRKIH